MSFVAQIMQPGGGVMLLPFVRLVIGCLMLLTSGAFIAGVARIHMAVLTVLSGGLMISLSFFESEYKKAQMRLNNNQQAAGTTHKNPTASNTTSATAPIKVAKTD